MTQEQTGGTATMTPQEEYNAPQSVRLSEYAQQKFKEINLITKEHTQTDKDIKPQKVVDAALTLYLEYLNVISQEGTFCGQMPDGRVRQYIIPILV